MEIDDDAFASYELIQVNLASDGTGIAVWCESALLTKSARGLVCGPIHRKCGCACPALPTQRWLSPCLQSPTSTRQGGMERKWTDGTGELRDQMAPVRSLMRAPGWANGWHCQLQLGRQAIESRQMISLISCSGSQIHMGVAADAIILGARQTQPARVMF